LTAIPHFSRTLSGQPSHDTFSSRSVWGEAVPRFHSVTSGQDSTRPAPHDDSVCMYRILPLPARQRLGRSWQIVLSSRNRPDKARQPRCGRGEFSGRRRPDNSPPRIAPSYRVVGGDGLGVLGGPDKTLSRKLRNSSKVLSRHGLPARIGVSAAVLIPPNRRD